MSRNVSVPNNQEEERHKSYKPEKTVTRGVIVFV